MAYEQLKLKNQLCFPLYAASREVVRLYKPHLDGIGLTYTQYLAMMVLWEQGDLNVKTLGDYLFLDSGTLTPLLKKLEAQGLIKRERSGADERHVVIRLTKKGRALEAQAAEIPGRIRQGLPLTDGDAKTLYHLLYQVLENSKP